MNMISTSAATGISGGPFDGWAVDLMHSFPPPPIEYEAAPPGSQRAAFERAYLNTFNNKGIRKHC